MSLFAHCTALTRITLPPYVQEIEAHAFTGCYALETVELSESLTIIGRYAFQNCGLKQIVIPHFVSEIAEGAFMYCRNLTDVTLPSRAKVARSYTERYQRDNPVGQGWVWDTRTVPGAFAETPFGKAHGIE